MIAMAEHADPLLSTHDAGRRLGVTTRQIWTLIETGRLPVVLKDVPGRRGRWPYVHQHDLDRIGGP